MNGKGSKSRITNYKKFKDNYDEINWGRIEFGNAICPYCRREIDTEVCWCGTEKKFHGTPIDDGHNFVPMGCECGYNIKS